MVDLFCTLNPEQTNRFNEEACSFVSAAKGMGIHLELSDLKALARARFEKQLEEAISNGQH